MTTFHLGDILNVLTGSDLAPGGLPAVRELLEHMTGQRPLDLGVIEAYVQSRVELRRQFPALTELRAPRFAYGVDTADWLAVQITRFGEQHEVTPMPAPEFALTATTKES